LRRRHVRVHRAGVGGRRPVRRRLGHPRRTVAACARGILAALVGAPGDRDEQNRTRLQKKTAMGHERSPSWTGSRPLDRTD
jgi:hypothetical protein